MDEYSQGSSNQVCLSGSSYQEPDIEDKSREEETMDILNNDFTDKWLLACSTIKTLIGKAGQFNSYIVQRMKSKEFDEKNSYREDKADAPNSVDKNQPALFSGGVLHQYQIDGLNWMKLLYENGLNGILADEMGLGKTAQSIAMIAHLVEQGLAGPFLVIAPLSTLANWKREFTRFTPMVPVILYHGEPSNRQVLRKRFEEKQLVVITSFDIIMKDKAALRSIIFKYLIIDECQRLKNYNCKLFRDLKDLKYNNLLLLTGTPLQNDLSELWSLLNIALPQIFSSLSQFEKIFDPAVVSSQELEHLVAVEEQKNHLISDIHQLLTPYILRRIKSDVNLRLPPKKEFIVYAQFSHLQQSYYSAIFNGTLEQLLTGNSMTDSVIVSGKRKRKRKTYYYDDENIEDTELNDDAFLEKLHTKISTVEKQSEDTRKIYKENVHVTSNKQMMMRQTAMHPYLLSHPINHRTGELLVDENLILSSGKMKLLDAMLPKLKEQGHKVLIFSQMVRMLNILIDYCAIRQYEYSTISGQMSLEERVREMEKFDQNPKSFLFLLSTRAGGLGINLTKADTVIIYDSDWNPQNDLQAQDRCHRIGQNMPVIVYRFITKGSIEETMLKRAIDKRKLEKLIIKDGCFNSSNSLTRRQSLLDEREIATLFNSCNVLPSVNCEVISDENLSYLLDRSEAAFSKTAKYNAKNVFMTATDYL